MGDEDAALLLPQMLEFDGVVDEGVAGVAVLALEGGGGGDHLDSGEMPRRPAALLRLGPGAAGQAGQDHRLLVADGLEQLHRVRHQVERVEEVRRRGQPGPEGLEAKALLEPARRHAEHRLGAPFEVGEDAVAVEIDAGFGPGRAGHGQRG